MVEGPICAKNFAQRPARSMAVAMSGLKIQLLPHMRQFDVVKLDQIVSDRASR